MILPFRKYTVQSDYQINIHFSFCTVSKIAYVDNLYSWVLVIIRAPLVREINLTHNKVIITRNQNW